MTPMLAQRSRPDRTFERIYRRHVRDVYRYAYAVLHNSADAEDVTQTTFLNAYRALERGEQPKTPHNWLIAIAHNVCRQRFRQSQRRPNEVALVDDVADRLVADDDDVPSGEEIGRALGELAFNQRAALVMRELEGRSYAEIAEVLELSVSAVETLIFRARRALREQLEGVLSCGEAELAISKQLDGRLSRAEKGQLRAHLRQCADCASFARRQRGQRSALKALGAVPLPASLATFLGGGGAVSAGAGAGAGVGVGLFAKAAAIVAATAVAGTAGYEGTRQITTHHHRAPARSAPATPVVPARAAPHAVTGTVTGTVPVTGGKRHHGGAKAAKHGHGAKAGHGNGSSPPGVAGARTPKARHAAKTPKPGHVHVTKATSSPPGVAGARPLKPQHAPQATSSPPGVAGARPGPKSSAKNSRK